MKWATFRVQLLLRFYQKLADSVSHDTCFVLVFVLPDYIPVTRTLSLTLSMRVFVFES